LFNYQYLKKKSASSLIHKTLHLLFVFPVLEG